VKLMPRIAIIHPFGNLNSVPCLQSAIAILLEQGYWVDVFTHSGVNGSKPCFADPRVMVFTRDPTVPDSLWDIPWKLYGRQVRQDGYFRYRHWRRPYACIIAVDPHGLAQSQILQEWFSVPLVYFSLELLLSHEVVSEQDRKLKSLEVRLSRESDFVIALGEERADWLVSDNGIDASRIICVPNAPLGAPRRQRSTFIGDKYGLSSECRIIIQAGTLTAWSGIFPLLQSSREWPDHWKLVVHARSSVDDKSAFVQALRYICGADRLLLSGNPLPDDEYRELIRSADVGVAFYLPQTENTYDQDNLRYLGLSSGKTAYYLQAGVPILVNETDSLKKLVSEYRCGVVTKNPEHTLGSLSVIFADYDAYCDNAVRCFELEFDFRKKFNLVLERLNLLRYEAIGRQKR